jgi:signal transduction histidine kinase
MRKNASERLKEKIPKIMNIWVDVTLEHVHAAHLQKTLALRNSLPTYLKQLVDALSTTIDRTTARNRYDKEESTRIGQKHGRERAGSILYTMDQMILEYHILRQVVCDELEEEGPLTDVEREVIVCSIEQAVNDAATEFSDTLRDMQEQLSQTLAHDLRSPIAAAKLNAEVILRKADADEFYLDKARKIVKNMKRVDIMISDLLDVSRLRAGQQLSLDLSTCDLEKIVKGIAEELNMETKQVIVKTPGPCLGTWNENGLRRMIENLANNGIKYGDEEKSITVSLSQNKTSTTIEVHNDGNPIPKEEQETLFYKYHRGKASDKKIGWGLGLTMVKGMVESHHGSINIISNTKQGTTFTIEIPNTPAS